MIRDTHIKELNKSLKKYLRIKKDYNNLFKFLKFDFICNNCLIFLYVKLYNRDENNHFICLFQCYPQVLSTVSAVVRSFLIKNIESPFNLERFNIIIFLILIILFKLH